MTDEHQLALFETPSPVTAVGTDEWKDSATFSPCGTYRFTLTRVVSGVDGGPNERCAVIVGCNPSVANAHKPDPTSTKGIGFARRWGCSRLLMVNPYAYVATDPDDMKRAAKAGIDVVGPGNDDVIRRAAGRALLSKGVLVLACGNDVTPERLEEVWRIVRFSGTPVLCLGHNKNGSPKHCLYLAYETPLVTWRTAP